MPRKHPLPARQLEIGQRFRAIRQELRWSRSDLQCLACIDAATCRNIEDGRAPLRYNTARRLLIFADKSALWLATGQGMQQSDIPLPTLKDMNLPEDSLFIDVFDSYLRPHWIVGGELLPKAAKSSYLTRWMLAAKLGFRARDQWLPRVPDSQLAPFTRQLVQAAEHVLSQYPDASPSTILEHRTALAAIDAEHEQRRNEKRVLTHIRLSENIAPVQDPMPRFRDRLRRATAARGNKAALAKFIGVSLSSISDWLAGRKEPSGESTLKLLHWVEQQEAQQQSPGSVSPLPGPKTQVRKSYEKKSKSGPPKT